MRKFSCLGVLAALAAVLQTERAGAAISGLTRVASGLSAPMFVTSAPGDPTRLFIVERSGPIKILNLTTGSVLATPFLSIPSVDTEGEGGLLGMAFHPDYATNGKFYVNVTIDNGGLVFQGATSPFSNYIREYTVSSNPNVANTGFNTVLSYIQPQTNHNAGWLGFSPNNGYLYIPTGDGGGAGDTGTGHTAGTGNAQDNTDNLLGKILRIDVNGDDFPGDANRNYKVIDSNPYADIRNPDRTVMTPVTGDDEIWALGMRNPFRDSFDRDTGDLWLGDVGQGTKEEIDQQPANAPGGENFGWRLIEGKPSVPSSPPFRDPVYDYARPVSPASDPTNLYRGTVVTGGYVYRGPDPSLQGKYFFLDSRNTSGTSDDNYWNFDIGNPTGTVANINSLLTANTGLHQFPVSFGEDFVGNLYIAYLSSGEVYRIATNQLLTGDYNADGNVDGADYVVYRNTFGQVGAGLPADGNNNGQIDVGDYGVWRTNFGTSVHAGAGAGLSAAVPEFASAVYLIQCMAMLTFGSLIRGCHNRPASTISSDPRKSAASPIETR